MKNYVHILIRTVSCSHPSQCKKDNAKGTCHAIYLVPLPATHWGYNTSVMYAATKVMLQVNGLPCVPSHEFVNTRVPKYTRQCHRDKGVLHNVFCDDLLFIICEKKATKNQENNILLSDILKHQIVPGTRWR